MRKIIQLALILLFAQPLFANSALDDFYIVEMIVFTNELRMYREEEIWPNDEQLAVETPLLFLEQISPNEIYPELNGKTNDSIESYQLPLLNDEKAQLQEAANKIKTAGRHRLLSHQVWLQKLSEKESALPIAVQAGRQVNGFYEVSGSITLHKSRYLHLESNLWRSIFTNDPEEAATITLPYIDPSLNAVAEESMSDFYQQVEFNEKNDDEFAMETKVEDLIEQPLVKIVSSLKHKRRMRSKETHFLDHPLFGVIIQLTPYNEQSD